MTAGRKRKCRHTPHDVAAREGEYQRASPDPITKTQCYQHGYFIRISSPDNWTRHQEEGSEDLRVVLALGTKDPRQSTQHEDDHQSDQ